MYTTVLATLHFSTRFVSYALMCGYYSFTTSQLSYASTRTVVQSHVFNYSSINCNSVRNFCNLSLLLLHFICYSTVTCKHVELRVAFFQFARTSDALTCFQALNSRAKPKPSMGILTSEARHSHAFTNETYYFSNERCSPLKQVVLH